MPTKDDNHGWPRSHQAVQYWFGIHPAAILRADEEPDRPFVYKVALKDGDQTWEGYLHAYDEHGRLIPQTITVAELVARKR